MGPETVSTEQVRTALRRVKGPDLIDDVVSLGLISDVTISAGRVTFAITVPPDRAARLEPMRQAAAKVVSALPGVTGVNVVLTAHSANPEAFAPAARPSPIAEAGLAGIAAIVAVGSGKGGVGKSTTAVNLALALSAGGLRVGLLDADVYGPSAPRMLGLTAQPRAESDQVLRPVQGYGIKVMSMGALVDEDEPIIWRGAMASAAISRMLRDVVWGELDILVVDLPPGTGDVQMTLCQQAPLSGAVIVSTPQDLALIDARRAINMFNEVGVRVLGLIENMSFFLCPECGERADLFGHGGARVEADRIGVPFLGEAPLHIDIRKMADAGTPIVAARPDGPQARVYCALAGALLRQLEPTLESANRSPGPAA